MPLQESADRDTTGPPEPGAGPPIRAAVRALPRYVAGRPSMGSPSLKLSSNENPFPPLPGVLEVVHAAAANLNRYPDMAATALIEALAARFDVSTDHLAVGTGSVAVLQQIMQSTVEPGDEVVYAWRSFEAYPIVAAVSGGRSVRVPLSADGRHDLVAMAAAITPRTRLVLVCSPNNPTGPAVTSDELHDFLRRVPSDVLVVLDEAYREFVSDLRVPDGVDLYREHPNVCVLRTFSKAYGLAGLRVGYAVAHPPLAGALRATAVPFGVSGVAQAAAVASLAAEAELLERVEQLVAERSRVRDALVEQGWPIPETEANFVWFPLGDDSADFAEACQAEGLVVRPFQGDGVRVTIGERAANDLLLGVARTFRERGAP